MKTSVAGLLFCSVFAASACPSAESSKETSTESEKRNTKSKASKSAKKKRPPQKVLIPKVTEAGNELPIKHAVAFHNGTKTVRVVMSTHPLPCDKVLTLMYEPRKGERQVRMALAPGFAEGGKDGPWHVAWVGPDGFMQAARGVDTPANGVKGDVAGMFEASIDVTAFRGKKSEHEKELQVKGKLRAKGCGVIKSKNPDKARPQKDLNVSIRGTKVPIVAARLDPLFNGGRELVLSTEPLSDRCKLHTSLNEDVRLNLFLSNWTDLKEAEFIYLNGERLEGERLILPTKKTVTKGPEKGGVMELTLHIEKGSFKVSGKVQAVICKPDK